MRSSTPKPPRIQAIRRKVYDSADYAEGFEACKEKRPPVFTGN